MSFRSQERDRLDKGNDTDTNKAPCEAFVLMANYKLVYTTPFKIPLDPHKNCFKTRFIFRAARPARTCRTRVHVQIEPRLLKSAEGVARKYVHYKTIAHRNSMKSPVLKKGFKTTSTTVMSKSNCTSGQRRSLVDGSWFWSIPFQPLLL